MLQATTPIVSNLSAPAVTLPKEFSLQYISTGSDIQVSTQRDKSKHEMIEILECWRNRENVPNDLRMQLRSLEIHLNNMTYCHEVIDQRQMYTNKKLLERIKNPLIIDTASIQKEIQEESVMLQVSRTPLKAKQKALLNVQDKIVKRREDYWKLMKANRDDHIKWHGLNIVCTQLQEAKKLKLMRMIEKHEEEFDYKGIAHDCNQMLLDE
jgi:hypothetical protein